MAVLRVEGALFLRVVAYEMIGLSMCVCLVFFFFMCLGVLLTCISVHHVLAWCLQRPSEKFGFSGPGIRQLWPGIDTGFSGRASSALNCSGIFQLHHQSFLLFQIWRFCNSTYYMTYMHSSKIKKNAYDYWMREWLGKCENEWTSHWVIWPYLLMISLRALKLAARKNDERM